MCRFCAYEDDVWTCTRTSETVSPGHACRMFRPGSCEYCVSFTPAADAATCALTGEEVHILDVCSDFVPRGGKSV